MLVVACRIWVCVSLILCDDWVKKWRAWRNPLVVVPPLLSSAVLTWGRYHYGTNAFGVISHLAVSRPSLCEKIGSKPRSVGDAGVGVGVGEEVGEVFVFAFLFGIFEIIFCADEISYFGLE